MATTQELRPIKDALTSKLNSINDELSSLRDEKLTVLNQNDAAYSKFVSSSFAASSPPFSEEKENKARQASAEYNQSKAALSRLNQNIDSLQQQSDSVSSELRSVSKQFNSALREELSLEKANFNNVQPPPSDKIQNQIKNSDAPEKFLENKNLEREQVTSPQPGEISGDFASSTSEGGDEERTVDAEGDAAGLEDLSEVRPFVSSEDEEAGPTLLNDAFTNPINSLLDTASKYANTAISAGKDLLGSASDILGFGKKKKQDTKPSPTKKTLCPAIATFPGTENRVRLVVPKSYIDLMASSPLAIISDALIRTNTVFFPYTPSIKTGHSANYSSVPVTHSNYTQYFYKQSEVEKISLTAKYTVQNQKDAENLLAVNHLFRALTKMSFGKDELKGAPPPVCQLFGWGAFMLDRVPVVIEKYSMELPDNVDYYSYFLGNERVSVPVMTNITLSLIPMYSREEILNSSVEGWLIGADRRNGLL